MHLPFVLVWREQIEVDESNIDKFLSSAPDLVKYSSIPQVHITVSPQRVRSVELALLHYPMMVDCGSS